MTLVGIPKNDLKKIIKVFNREIGRFVLFVFVLFFDSIYFSKNISNSQWWINTLMLIGFFKMFYRSTPRVKEFMVYAVILGVGGEYLFSRLLGMYTYRLENVPLYVPIGHAALFGRVFMFSKASIVRKYQVQIASLFSVIIMVFSLIYLCFFKDFFGFLMTLVIFALMWKNEKNRLFYYTMYFLVAVLEIGGTAFGCWQWPKIAFQKLPFLPSNNPPTGISLFYYLLDIGCFILYFLRNKMVWQRMKSIRLVKISL